MSDGLTLFITVAADSAPQNNTLRVRELARGC